MSTITSAMVSKMLAFMVAAEGKGYSEAANLRLGPTDYDCSGLVYEAAKSAGINIPQGDDIANLEANYLGSLPGVTVIKNSADIKTGDVLFFTGAEPGSSNYGAIGHTGMALSNSTFVSALGTGYGVVAEPDSYGGGFVVGMRLTGGTVTDPSSSSDSSSGQGVLGDLAGLGSVATSIGGLAKDFDNVSTAFSHLIDPSFWFRIGAFLVGLALLGGAVYTLVKASGVDVPTPTIVPIPI
jgi:hypothetical protein